MAKQLREIEEKFRL